MRSLSLLLSLCLPLGALSAVPSSGVSLLAINVGSEVCALPPCLSLSPFSPSL